MESNNWFGEGDSSTMDTNSKLQLLNDLYKKAKAENNTQVMGLVEGELRRMRESGQLNSNVTRLLGSRNKGNR